MDKLTIEAYIAQRWKPQYAYYSKASRNCKWWFQRLRIAEIGVAAMIPFLSGIIDEAQFLRYIVGALGVAVTLIGGTLMVKKYQENWINYRSTTEALKSEHIAFLTRSGNYAKGDAEAEFIRRVETILGDENQKWRNYITSTEENGANA